MKSERQYIFKYNSPIGEITMASDGQSILGLWIAGQKYFASTLLPDYIEKELPVFELTKSWLDVYFSGQAPNFLPPISFVSQSDFSSKVLKILLEIPFGYTRTYGDIAKQIEQEDKKKVSAQAVGGAVKRNPISIIVPCHRVIGKNGNLTGYAGGIELKEKLLNHERRYDEK